MPLIGGAFSGVVTFASTQTFASTKISASGVQNGTNFLRDDGTWAAAGFGNSPGDIVMGIGTSKSGYLLCNGAIYTRTSYSALATAIGTPISPIATLGNSTTANPAGQISEANGLLFKTGSVATTGPAAANGILVSSDGITWTARTGLNMKAPTNGNQAAYGNSVYVLNNNYSVYPSPSAPYQTTPDGVTFTTRSINTGTNTSPDIRAVAFGGTSNRHVMCYAYQSYSGCVQTAYTVRLVYSTDGINWTTGDTNTISSASVQHPYSDVAGYSGGFVSVQYRSDGVNYIKYSADGATWTDITSNVNSVAAISGIVRWVSYANGRFIIVTSNGQIYTSTTGASGTWSLIVPANTSFAFKIRGNANAYVMATTSNTFYSTNLIDWTALPNLGLGALLVTATPASGTRFFGTLASGDTNAYYTDLFNYTTSTQFVVPKLSTYANGSLSSPNYQNNVAINYFIKT